MGQKRRGNSGETGLVRDLKGKADQLSGTSKGLQNAKGSRKDDGNGNETATRWLGIAGTSWDRQSQEFEIDRMLLSRRASQAFV